MSGPNPADRVIAFEVRSDRVGYAIFEGPERLLDWGIKSFRSGVNAVRVPFAMKVTNLLLDWRPRTVLLKQIKIGPLPEKARVIQELADPAGIKVHFVDRNAIIKSFPSAENKYDRARLLVVSFPELSEQLRPKRKPWQPEHYQLSIFDAALLAHAYFQSESI